MKLGLSVEEVSRILGLSKTTIYSMARNNEIPHAKVRGRIIFHYETLEEWLKSEARKSDVDLII